MGESTHECESGGWWSEAAHFEVQPTSATSTRDLGRDSTARYQLHPNTTMTALLCRPLLLSFSSHAHDGQASRYQKAKRTGPDRSDCALANDWSASARSNGTAQHRITYLPTILADTSHHLSLDRILF